MRNLSLLALALGLAAAGCSSNPVDVAGTYTINVTNEDNGCNLMNWTSGDSTSGISVVITQSGSSAQATVQGLTGTYLNAVLGSNVFSGDVDGDHLSLKLSGTTHQTSGDCSWTFTANLNADLGGDALDNGTIDYVEVTNQGSDCQPSQSTCKSTQDFNGTRPPS